MNVSSSRARKPRLMLSLAGVGVFAAACGGSYGATKAVQPAQAAPSNTTAAGAVTIAVGHDAVGSYLTDGHGRALYLFAKDPAGKSVCVGSCATYWPPLTGSSATVDGAGVQAAMSATTTRAGGATQVTYATHPLYYYAGDAKAGDTKGQGLDVSGGKWWLVSPQGAAITSAGPASTPASTSSGSSYGGGY